MAQQLYLFRTAQSPDVPVFGLRNGVVAAIANLDDADTAAARLATVIAQAASIGLNLPADYFAAGVALTALATGSFSNDLADADDVLFIAERATHKAEGP